MLNAAEDWGLCSTPIIKKQDTNSLLTQQPIFVSADILNISQSKAQFQGNVIFKQQPDTLINSEELLYDSETETLSSQRSSVFTSSTNQIKSSSFLFEKTSQSGEFNQA